jgi:hypothetical protein
MVNSNIFVPEEMTCSQPSESFLPKKHGPNNFPDEKEQQRPSSIHGQLTNLERIANKQLPRSTKFCC